MHELTMSEVDFVSGGQRHISNDAAYGAAVGAAAGLLAIGVGMALMGQAVVGAGIIYTMLGGSIGSSAVAGWYAWY